MRTPAGFGFFWLNRYLILSAAAGVTSSAAGALLGVRRPGVAETDSVAVDILGGLVTTRVARWRVADVNLSMASKKSGARTSDVQDKVRRVKNRFVCFRRYRFAVCGCCGIAWEMHLLFRWRGIVHLWLLCSAGARRLFTGPRLINLTADELMDSVQCTVPVAERNG